jgi:DNA modification methylase
MGDRISISFYDGHRESVAFFSHWDGMELVADAQAFIKSLGPYSKDSQMTPLNRREAGMVMVGFVSWLLKGKIPDSNYYFGQMKDPMYGDNSDNGHYKIDTKTGKVIE